VLDYIASFTQSFIITILSNLIPDMIVSKRSDNTWGLSTEFLNIKYKNNFSKRDYRDNCNAAQIINRAEENLII
jgi:hypothetical protein